MQSVCIFHNGNQRILEHYKALYSDLNFVGNLSESVTWPSHNSLWEVCFADASIELLYRAKSAGIKILRHVSTYQDDLDNRLPECGKFDYDQWLQHVVCNLISLADQIVCDWTLPSKTVNETVIITTGRTANTHLQRAMLIKGAKFYECSKKYDHNFFAASAAVLLWRLDQFACLTSNWIAAETKYRYAHQLTHGASHSFSTVNPITTEWVHNEWVNSCKLVLDQAMTSKYLMQRSTVRTTTEQIIHKLISNHTKLGYNKNQVIPNYREIEQYYIGSEVEKMLHYLYNNVCEHIPEWNLDLCV